MSAEPFQFNLQTTGQTLYVVAWDINGNGWEPGGSTFITFTTTTSNFKIAMTEVGSTGYYIAPFTAPAGFTRWNYFKQLGDSPNALTDTLLAVGSDYWTGTSFGQAVTANVTVNPVSVTVSAGQVSESPITAYQYAAFGPYQFAIVDSTGSPKNLSGHSITFVAETSQAQFLWEITSCPISGAGNNVVTVNEGATHTGTAGKFRYVLRDLTENSVLARGPLAIPSDANIE
ncbi:MAG TPA: hypothetical protein VFE46_10805 [Pirellulales bacterium]|jgi:hypothetical protein|nr:hypothetical protein [Pirellulales bacterium]